MKRTDQSSRSLAQGSRQSSKIFNLLALAVACALNVDEAFAVGTGQVKLAQVRNRSYVNSVTVSSTAAQIIEEQLESDSLSSVSKQSMTFHEPQDLIMEDNDSSSLDNNQAVTQLVQEDSTTDSSVQTTAEMSTLSKWLQERPYLVVILAVASVVGCCFCSQILLRFSKQCNLSLNRYYIRKRFEKQKMMQNTIQQTRQMRVNQNRQRRQAEERGQGANELAEESKSLSDRYEEEQQDNEGQLELELDPEVTPDDVATK